MKKTLNNDVALAGGTSRILSGSTLLLLTLTLLLTSPMIMAQNKTRQSSTADATTSANKLREFYRSYIAAANARDFDAIAKVVAEDVKLNGVMVKREAIITEFKKLVDAVPDFKWNLEDLVVDGDRIGARLRDTGTPGVTTFFGQNPGKKSVVFTEYGSYKVRDGLFVEMWYLIDVPSISQQLKN